MKNWLHKNLKNIIITAFVIPILLVAFVSISHVTSFYGLSNPITCAVYLSIGIEIAALSALAAVSVNMGRFVYLPFFVVTLIQMIGNIFFSFTYIDETSQLFQDWVSMVGGLFENMGIEKTDLNTHKTIVSFLSGGLLPIISLTFAHMLVKFSEQNAQQDEVKKEIMSEEEFKEILKQRRENSENEKWMPTEEDLKKIQTILENNYPKKEEKVEEPYKPTEEDLNKLEEVLNNNYDKEENENIEIIENNPYGEHPSEFINDNEILNKLISDDIEKKRTNRRGFKLQGSNLFKKKWMKLSNMVSLKNLRRTRRNDK